MDHQILADIREQTERHQAQIDLLTEIRSNIDARIDGEVDGMVQLRIELLNQYPDDDVESLLDLHPGSPRELLERTIEIIGEEPPVMVIETLLHEYEFDVDAADELKSDDDIIIVEKPLDTILSYESFHMPDK